MGDLRHHTRSFGGGVVTPEFYGRIDDAKFQTGLATCENFTVTPHGPIENRAGTKFVRLVKDSTKLTRTLPFVYSFDQQLLIEFAEGAFRFHALGETLLAPAGSAWVTATDYEQGDIVTNGGNTYYAKDAHTSGGTFAGDLAAHWYIQTNGVYEVPHDYLEAELFEVAYAQSGDLLRLRHKNHPRRTLTRRGATDWVLTDDAQGPVLEAPANLTGTATPGGTPSTPFDTDYVVTALTSTEDESLASAVETVSNNLYDDGAYNELEWDAATNAVRYNIYKKSAGLFGFIGQTDQLEYRDDNIAPDLGTTPPLDISLFDATGEYPGAVSYYDQRLFEGGSTLEPMNIWGTRSGTEQNFNYSIPPKDNDSLQFKLASREANNVRHLVAMGDLLALTPAAIWKISGGLSDILTPTTLAVRQQSFVGASSTKPVLIGNNLVYVAARGGHLRELGFDGERGYISGDVSIRAPHLFDGYDIRSMTVQQAPYPVVWAVSTSGSLVGFTYIPEQQIGAFHIHTTQGSFEDVTIINEGGRDVLYTVVNRTLDGETRRCIEYFETRLFADQEDQYFVDCGATYDGVPADEITGLDWLEGETVSILADGGVMAPREVSGGAITLDEEASVVHVGLPYTCDVKTMPLAIELQGYGQGQPKNISEVFLRVYRSAGIFAGPSFDELTEAKIRTTESMGSPPALQTGIVDLKIKGAWDDDGQVCIRQSDPIALTVLSVTVDFALGGG